MATVRQAVVLAAGKGERLYPLTALRPKAMLRIGNKPVLQHVVEALAQCGIDDIVLVVGYRCKQVQDYFGGGRDFGVTVRYAHQDNQLGTAHALSCARDLVRGRFLVLPGDNIIEAETLLPLVDQVHDAVLVKEGECARRYGVVLAQGDRVAGLVEKPREQVSPWLNTGIYSLDLGVFDELEGQLDLPDVLQARLARGPGMRVLRSGATWLAADTPWDLLRLNALAIEGIVHQVEGTVEEGVTIKGPVRIGRGSVVRAGSYIVGPVVIGDDCDIGPGACLFAHTSIGNDSIIGPYTVIRSSIIENAVHVGPHSVLQDTVLAQGVHAAGALGARSGAFTAVVENETVRLRCGPIVGEYVELGHGVVLSPGVLVGKGAKVRDGRVVTEGVPEGALVL